MSGALRSGSIQPSFDAPIFMPIRAVTVLNGDWLGYGVV
jgi:hypothetical protein